MTTVLSVVQPPPEHPAPESIGARVQRLQAEAKGLAAEHIKALEAALLEASRLAAEIAQMGEAAPVGVRELAERLPSDLDAVRLNIRSLMGRAK